MKRILLAGAIAVAAGCSTIEPQPTSTHSYQSDQPTQSALVGPRGPDGPAGPAGVQGQTGQTGAAGYAVAGQRGEAGATGAAGERGLAGARGSAGEVARGQAGAVGPAGAAGAEGAIGQTGARGASGEGLAGSAGATGQAGARGATGEAGERGVTLIGPTGPAGRAGPAGERGVAGETGAVGSTTAGVAGAAGVAGQAGPRGEIGPAGPQGPAGVIAQWVAYREFWFEPDQAAVHQNDAAKAAEIAAYLSQNPSLQIGIDSSMSPGSTDQRRLDLAANRGNAVRESLIAAGIPASKISLGAFGDANSRRDQRVGVLIRTDPNPQAHQTQPTADSPPQQDMRTSSTRAQSAQTTSTGVAAETAATDGWNPYREFWFDADQAVVHRADAGKLTQIAAYLKQNPSVQLGLDGSRNPRATAQRDIDLSDRRVKAVRDALIAAGVPADRISQGTFGDAELRRDGRVEVLIRDSQRFTQAD